jgi:alpha-galactosidase
MGIGERILIFIKMQKQGSTKLQTGTIYMSYTNMNLPKDESNTFELKVCYTKEDVYILWKKYMQKKKMQLNLRDCVFQKNAKSWRRS